MFAIINDSTKKGNDALFIIMEDITEEICKEAIAWIINANFMDSEDAPDVLTLMVCSNGGDLNPAFALIDVMRGSAIPVRTIALGGVASAGLFIVMAGEAGMRISTPNTSFMSHHFSGGMTGNRHELLAQVKEFDNVHRRIVNFYMECTGLDEDTIVKELLGPTNSYLTPDEAVRYNLCDSVKTLN